MSSVKTFGDYKKEINKERKSRGEGEVGVRKASTVRQRQSQTH